MSTSDQNSSADEHFERLLIDSARGDRMPSDVDVAWQKFGAALSGVSVLGAGAGGALAVRRAQRWLAAKWLIWGALAGSALTVFGLRPNHPPRVDPSPTMSAAITVPTLASSEPSPAIVARAEPQVPTRSTVSGKSAPHSIRARAPSSRGEVAPLPSSTLSAEVALLDAARARMLAGAFAEALELADRYRVAFPTGELAPEAEVVAIEALVGQAERQPALARAARFFERYPGDPHTARVKWLVR